jgi:hypothetical protein
MHSDLPERPSERDRTFQNTEKWAIVPILHVMTQCDAPFYDNSSHVTTRGRTFWHDKLAAN